MDEETIRIHLSKIVSQLEYGLTEISKIMNSLKALIGTIDTVLLKLEFQDGCCPALESEDRCTLYHWLSRDINQNVQTALTEDQWQAYASHDWFAGFKQFPRRCKVTTSVLSESCNPSNTTCNHFYLQVAEVLLKIESILHSLEKNTFSKNAFPNSPMKQKCIEYIEDKSVQTSFSPLHLSARLSVLPEESTPSSEDNDDFPYYILSADILGDYEDKLDDALENIAGEASDDDESIFLASGKSSTLFYSASLPSTAEVTKNSLPCELENYFE